MRCVPLSFREAGAAGYTANPVNFDGTNDYLTRGAALSGSADGRAATIAFWFRIPSSFTFGAVNIISQNSGANNRGLRVRVNSAGVELRGFTGAGGSQLVVDGIGGAGLNDNAWHHVYITFDLTNASNRAIYFDGVNDTPTWTTYDNNDIDFNQANFRVGASGENTSLMTGDLAEVFVAFSYLDVGSNLASFISGGAPVNPTGWPAGIVKLYGATASWEINQGTGGGFTEVGALTNGTGPVEV